VELNQRLVDAALEAAEPALLRIRARTAGTS
jgi:hypothetical protein